MIDYSAAFENAWFLLFQGFAFAFSWYMLVCIGPGVLYNFAITAITSR